MRVSCFILMCLQILIAACTSTSLATLTPANRDTLCDSWSLSESDGFCLQINEQSLLIQSSINPLTLNNYQMSLVVDGTIFIEMSEPMRIVALEGRAFIGVQGQNRLLSAGREVTIPMLDSIAQYPSEIRFVSSSIDIANEFIDALPRSIEMFTLVPIATPSMLAIPTMSRDVCTVVDIWRGQYIVEAGDSLSAIANRFGLSVSELSEGNCLENGSRITVGQVLSVPLDESGVNQAQGIGFRADDYIIEDGSCTILRWDVSNVRSILLDDNPVAENSLQEICPQETQTYTLTVTYADNSEGVRQITISVQE